MQIKNFTAQIIISLDNNLGLTNLILCYIGLGTKYNNTLNFKSLPST